MRRIVRAKALATGLAAALLFVVAGARAEPPPLESQPHADAWIAYEAPPRVANEVRACSFATPICVHAPRGTSALPLLAAADRAWSTLTGALGLPVPDVDPDTLAYEVYLVPGATTRTALASRDVRSRFDRARTFTIAGSASGGCAAESAIARATARAVAFRVAPAMDEGDATATSAYLASLVVPCAIAFDADAAATFQSRPDRAIADGAGPEGDLFTRGAALWWSRVDWAFGRTPGAIAVASWALAPTMTEVGAARWNDEPDLFDVLRTSFKDALFTRSTIDDLLLEVAVARAFYGNADDGIHQPETRTLGPAATIELERAPVPWPNHPKRYASHAPVAPSGASYFVVDTSKAPKGARLRAEIEWEQHALFRWAFVKLDAEGRELGRVAIPTSDRATEVQMTLVDLEGVDRVMLVGANAGDPAYRFDPDDASPEPHGWLLTIAAEP